jgi:putative DNA primase/helicase
VTMTTSRPVVPFDATQIPDELKAVERWTLWKPKPKADGSFEKPPVLVSDGYTYATKTNPEHWSTFDAAVASLERHGKLHGRQHNVCGLTFHFGGGFTGIDFDNCIDPETREITDPEVAEFIQALGTYTEFSPSGTGLRCIVAGKLPGPNVQTDFVEMWDNSNGCATMTGAKLEWAPSTVAPAGEALGRLYQRAKASTAKKPEISATASPVTADQTAGRPVTPPAGEVPDDEVRRAAGIVNKKFDALWNGGGDDGNESRGDIRLANILAGLCGPSGEAQVARLMKQSGRNRDKFDERRKKGTYLSFTVQKAFKTRTSYFDWSQWYSSSKKEKSTGESHKKKSTEVGEEATLTGEPACGAASFSDLSSQTDVGLARRLALQARGTLRYCEETREWMGWNGKQWKRDNGLRANAVAKKMTDAIWREWFKLPGETDEEKKAKNGKRRFVENASSARCISAAVTLARGEPDIIVSANELDQHPMLINLRNGVFDLEKLELMPHNPKYLITQMAGAAYDPKANCPRWRKFLAEVTAGENAKEIEGFLQRLAGLCLTADVSDHVVTFLSGQGSNGKSVFLAVLNEVLGSYAATAPAELLMSKGQRGREVELLYGGLVGRRLVTVTENEMGTRLSEATVKQLCGGDRVLWRRLYADPVETVPTWKIVVSTNHKPTVRGGDDGIWRRLVPVPWRNSFIGANADPKLISKLHEELSGIFNWALFGLEEWRRLGGLAIPECLKEEKKEYRAACDVLGQWKAERCVETSTAVALAGDLYRDFSGWCDDRGEHAGTATQFGLELERLGFKSDRPTAGSFRFKTIRRGIGLMHGSET